MKNPFRPSAGAMPPDLIGRAGLLDEFDYGMTLGAGAPGLLTIFTGARGVGKTVMLSAAHDLAVSRGWLAISETATPGFMGRLGESMRKAAEELGDGPQVRRVTAVAALGFSVTTSLPPERQVAWRTIGETLLRILNEKGTGLIITVDEIHSADRNEIAQLSATVQHFIRDDLPIGLVFAGLPAAVSDLLNEGVATFLRRADKIDLHATAIRDVETSYLDTFTKSPWTVDPAQLQRAAEATGGYPFLIQLVGYFLWREAEIGTLDTGAVDRALTAASRRNSRTVIEAALSDVSDRDLAFLQAMAQDDGPSTTADIGIRTGSTKSNVSNFKARLLAAGLVDGAGHGKVVFAIPGLREHLLSLSR